MTKKIKQSVTVSQRWLSITSRLVDSFVEQNKQLQNNKRIKNNLDVCLYIIYDLLYKKHFDRNIDLEYFSLNYHSLQQWSQLSYNFPKFFRFLLDRHIIERWQSETINPRTNRPYAYCFHSKGVVGTCAKYKLNTKLIRCMQNTPETTIYLDVSQKNDYFYHVVPLNIYTRNFSNTCITSSYEISIAYKYFFRYFSHISLRSSLSETCFKIPSTSAICSVLPRCCAVAFNASFKDSFQGNKRLYYNIEEISNYFSINFNI